MPRLPADFRISLKCRSGKAQPIELVRKGVQPAVLARTNGKDRRGNKCRLSLRVRCDFRGAKGN